MSVDNPYISIKDLAEEDRPREKLVLNGRGALSSAEIIAILIGSGNSKESAVQLAQRILASCENDLSQLAKLTVNDLQKFNGIGEAKAVSIIAALELGRRRLLADESQISKVVSSSRDAYQVFLPKLQDLPHEEFWLCILNRRNKVIKTINISRGGVSGTVVDIKIALKHSIENLASSIIVAHNHPSGSLIPSTADKNITHKLKESAKLMDVGLIDHIIVGDNDYFSFADEGLI